MKSKDAVQFNSTVRLHCNIKRQFNLFDLSGHPPDHGLDLLNLLKALLIACCQIITSNDHEGREDEEYEVFLVSIRKNRFPSCHLLYGHFSCTPDNVVGGSLNKKYMERPAKIRAYTLLVINFPGS